MQKILNFAVICIFIILKIFRFFNGNHIQFWFTYTNFSNMLAVICSIYSIFSNNNEKLFNTTWNSLFAITVGYWCLIYPIQYNYLELIAHGPILIIYTILMVINDIKLNNLIYSYYFLYFYAIVWLIYFYITKNPIYHHHKYPLSLKSILINLTFIHIALYIGQLIIYCWRKSSLRSFIDN